MKTFIYYLLLAGILVIALPIIVKAGNTSVSLRPILVPQRPTLRVTRDYRLPSQNIAIDVPNQPLGGFVIDVTREPVVVQKTVFRMNRWAGSGDDTSDRDITDVTLQLKDGTILAGPVSIDVSSPVLTFSDSIIYPIGTTEVVIRGKLGIDYINGDLIAASTTPKVDWKNVVGQYSGNIVIPEPGYPVTGPIMTARVPAVSIGVSSNPPPQIVQAPREQFVFANYSFDTTQSGEDLRVLSWPFKYTVQEGDPKNLRRCKLYDDRDNVLTTGANVVDPIEGSPSIVFRFDNYLGPILNSRLSTNAINDSGYVFKKNSVIFLTLKCDIIAGASGKYAWGYDEISNPLAIGVDSGNSATIVENGRMGQVITVIP